MNSVSGNKQTNKKSFRKRGKVKTLIVEEIWGKGDLLLVDLGLKNDWGKSCSQKGQDKRGNRGAEERRKGSRNHACR